jgi:hypothetical protein
MDVIAGILGRLGNERFTSGCHSRISPPRCTAKTRLAIATPGSCSSFSQRRSFSQLTVILVSAMAGCSHGSNAQWKYQMLGVFAEFERAMIQARINAGLARAREHGTRSGKPIGRPMLSTKLEAAVRRHLHRGTGILKTARLVGVGSGTVQRIRREMASA